MGQGRIGRMTGNPLPVGQSSIEDHYPGSFHRQQGGRAPERQHRRTGKGNGRAAEARYVLWGKASMKFVASITTAVKIICLVAGYRKGADPGAGRKTTTAHPEPITDIAEIRAILSSPEKFINEKRHLTLTIANCSLLAAPFLMFHLKRLGFSRCRTVRTENGLSVSALR